VSLQDRKPLRACGKHWDTKDEAESSPRAVSNPSLKAESCSYYGGWHLKAEVRPRTLAGPRTAFRARPRKALPKASRKRQAENRQRRKVVADLYGGERPPCEWPECTRLADDVHEPLTRGRGGSITDRKNMKALCRPHHDKVTFTPESELAEAYEAGLLRHSWDGDGNG
jgi:5-methylcytosine-specific restriction endonuclease McrA